MQPESARSQAVQNMSLQVFQMLIQNQLQRFLTQRFIGDGHVDPVHELRRKLTPRRRMRNLIQPFAGVIRVVHADWLKPKAGAQLFHHRPRAQVTGEKDQALFEIDRVVVTQPQRRLVQNAEQ